MKNKKNTIRLTESELKRMIVESAKNIISELDWKTYANAAKKRYNQWAQTYWKDDKDTKKKFKSYRDLLDASRDAFKRDYSYSDNDGYIDAYVDDNISSGEIRTTTLKPDGSDFQTSAPYFVTNQNFYGQNGRHQPGKWCVGTVGWAGAISASPDFDTEEEAVEYAQKHNLRLVPQDKISDKLLSKWQDSYDEINNYYRGKYKYTKDKGWHLPESIISKAINESFKSIIKEHDLMPGKNGGYFSTSDYIDSQKWTWRGVPNTQIIWHGENADYEVMYEDELLNGNELDDYAWSVYQDETDNKGNEQEFDNLPSEWFANILEDFSFGYYQ